jgi:hypothetical protein
MTPCLFSGGFSGGGFYFVTYFTKLYVSLAFRGLRFGVSLAFRGLRFGLMGYRQPLKVYDLSVAFIGLRFIDSLYRSTIWAYGLLRI